MRQMARTELHSIVVPVFCERETVAELTRRLSEALADTPNFEILFVEDHSPDETYDILLDLAAADSRIRVVRLSRRAGHQTALTAGIDLASGDTVTVMDGDLQHPPEVVPHMIQLWRGGADVVFGIKKDRSHDTRFKRSTASLYYGSMRLLADGDIPAHASDFRLMSRRATNTLKAMRERNRYLRGLVGTMGLRREFVEFEIEPRFAGTTTYSLPRLVALAADGVTSFSTAPLKIATWLGLAIALAGLAYGVVVVGLWLGGRIVVEGYASLLVAVLVLGGVQLLVLGMMGSYLGRIYDEVRGRPLYLVEELTNFEGSIHDAFADNCVPVPEAAPSKAAVADPESQSAETET